MLDTSHSSQRAPRQGWRTTTHCQPPPSPTASSVCTDASQQAPPPVPQAPRREGPTEAFPTGGLSASRCQSSRHNGEQSGKSQSSGTCACVGSVMIECPCIILLIYTIVMLYQYHVMSNWHHYPSDGKSKNHYHAKASGGKLPSVSQTQQPRWPRAGSLPGQMQRGRRAGRWPGWPPFISILPTPDKPGRENAGHSLGPGPEPCTPCV